MANHYGSAGAAAAQLAMHAVVNAHSIWPYMARLLDRSLAHVLRNGIYARAQSSLLAYKT